MKKVKKVTCIASVVAIVLVMAFALSSIKVHLQDIHPLEIGLFGPSLQLFGIDYRIEDHDTDKEIPEDVAKIYVSMKDYFKAKEAISRSHALMGIIDECLYSFADNVGLKERPQK